jgi:hypothetical protein
MTNTKTTAVPRRASTARTLIRRLRGEHSRSASTAAVHFHNGPQGAPAVCDDPRCASPRLDV